MDLRELGKEFCDKIRAELVRGGAVVVEEFEESDSWQWSGRFKMEGVVYTVTVFSWGGDGDEG